MRLKTSRCSNYSSGISVGNIMSNEYKLQRKGFKFNTVARDVRGGKRILMINIKAQHSAFSRAMHSNNLNNLKV